MKTHMKVRLLEYTPNPEKTVATAAKLCYSKSGIENIEDGLDDEKIAKFLDMLVDIGHGSPIEHVSFTFGIEGVSRSLTHQLVRHRIASYSQKSQRYVSEGQFEYVIPPEIENNKEACDRFVAAMESAQKYYNEVTDILSKQHMEDFLSHGMDEKKARLSAQKKAIEDARFILPNACETKIIATMNARALLNFFRHRCCNRAQWEIRELAEKMFIEVYKVAPNIFKNAGPGCINGRCPEGNMSCGKMREMVDKYKVLRSIK